jgi:hypothetical protein
MKNINEILHAYLICALWSSTNNISDTEYEPFDANYDTEDFSVDFVNNAIGDIKQFVTMAGEMLYDWDEEQIGHDLWLTRNGHGAGFWDRDKPFKKELTELCKHIFNEINLYVVEIDGENTIEGE